MRASFCSVSPRLFVPIKNKETQTKCSQILEEWWRNIFFVCSVNYSLHWTEQTVDISPVVIVLVRVLGTVYQEGVTNECDRIDPNSIELFSAASKAIIRLLEIS